MPELSIVNGVLASIKEAVEQQFDKSRLTYVSRFEGRARRLPDDDEISWVVSEEEYGMAPVVSAMQNSPVAPQGTYGQLRASGIETRHVKVFTRDELKKIFSPDKRFRVDAVFHLQREYNNSYARQLRLIEYVAHACTARGSLRYVNNDANNRVNINLSFPINTRTVSATWSNPSTDIITQMQTWLDEYALAGNGKPAAIRMTTNVWRHIRDNTGIKNYFANVRYTKADIGGGVITPAMVSDALGWPPIEIYDERNSLKFTAKDAVTTGASRTINLVEGTFGLNVGDKLYTRYNSTAGTWDDELTITAITDGVSVTVANVTSAIAIGDALVAKPYFFPSDRILFVPSESSNNIEFGRMPFGIEASGGDLRLLNRYGIFIDAFDKGTEPNIAVFRRFWDKFVWRINPRVYMSCKVIL